MKKTFLILLAVSVALVACQKEGSPEISCTQDVQHNVPYQGGSVKTYVRSNTTWTTSCIDETDVTIEPASGKGDTEVTISYNENSDLCSRGAKVTFNAEKGTKHAYAYFVISQDCRNFLFCTNPLEYVSAEGGDVYFHVNSNSPWSLTAAFRDGELWSDAQIKPVSNKINAVDVVVTVPENLSFETVCYDIVLTLDNGLDIAEMEIIQDPVI